MRGFTLIEAMVALVVLALAATALSQCLLLAQRGQRESGRWMRAVALADEAVERARVRPGSGSDVVGIFERHWSSSAGGGTRRIEVVVEWAEQQFHLQTAVRD